MGVSPLGTKQLNSDMDAPEFLSTTEFELGYFSAKGSRRGHKKNEDSLGVAIDSSHLTLVVSDGLGGHKMGDRASQIAIKTLLGVKSDSAAPVKPHSMPMKIEKAHEKIRELKVDAGATVVAAIVQGDGLWFYSVGDSVGGLLSADGEVLYKTFEHSVTGFATESGLLSSDDAKTHRDSHVILNSLGSHDGRLESSFRLAFPNRATVFLCSDGLTEVMNLPEIASFLRDHQFRQGVEALLRQCREIRGQMADCDDLSLIACRKK